MIEANLGLMHFSPRFGSKRSQDDHRLPACHATMRKEWMGFDDLKSVLKSSYPTLGVFA